MEALSHLAAQRLSKGENSVGWKALLMIKFMLREWRLAKKLFVIMNNCFGFSAVCQHHGCSSLTKVSALVFVIFARIYEEWNYSKDKAVSQTTTCGREISVYDETTKKRNLDELEGINCVSKWYHSGLRRRNYESGREFSIFARRNASNLCRNKFDSKTKLNSRIHVDGAEN